MQNISFFRSSLEERRGCFFAIPDAVSETVRCFRPEPAVCLNGTDLAIPVSETTRRVGPTAAGYRNKIRIMATFRLDANAQRAIDDYVEYDRVVGNADGGKMFSEAEYEAFKASVSDARKPENRLYVNYRCMSTRMDCKTVGPSSRLKPTITV